MENKVSRNEVLNCMISTAMAEISIQESYWNMVAISEKFGEYAKKVPYATSLYITDLISGTKVSFLWIPKKPFGQQNGPDCTEIISMNYKDKVKTVWSNSRLTHKVLTDNYEQVQNIINNTISEDLEKNGINIDTHMYSEEWHNGWLIDTRVRSRKKKQSTQQN